jgi:glucose/arabinose dehydrogenase
MTGSRAVIGAAAIAVALLGGCTGTERSGTAATTPAGASGSAPGSARPGDTAGGRATPATTGRATGPSTPSAGPAPVHGSVRVVRTVADGINVPWGLARLGEDELLVNSRDSRTITRVDIATGRKTRAGEITQARSNGTRGGEGGLLGLAVSPDFTRNHVLYVYYSTDRDNRIARVTLDRDAQPGQQLRDLQVIVDGIPHGLHHNGGRMAFGPDGMLYATTGEAGDPELSQDRSSLGGKILRMTTSGAPAPGNPDPRSLVWSYGHRNVQGLAWDPAGRLWASEFGERTADELNLIVKDHNYGWPDTQGRTDNPDYTSPVAQWGTEVDSPSGIAYAGGAIWMAALRGERLWRIPLDGTRTAGPPEDFLNGRHGRLRSVLALDDHTLLVTTSNTDGRGAPDRSDDRILELAVR